MNEGPNEVSLERALGFLRRRAIWIVLCVLLAGGAAYYVSHRQTKKYTTTASLVFGESLNAQIAGLQPTSSGDPQVQQGTNVELAKLGGTARKTARLVGHGLSQDDVSGSLSIGTAGNTDVVNVSATSSSPALAATIANTYARQFVKAQSASDRRAFGAALRVVEKRLAAIPAAERSSPAAAALQDRAQSLAILAQVPSSGIHVAQRATIPTSPSSPDVARNTVLGAALGFVIGLGIALLLERLDRRIREPQDLEAIYGLPLLGLVPESRAIARSARRKGGSRKDLPPTDAEAFRMIRAHLRYFNVDRDVRTLLVVSGAPGDGKTTVAHHLAEADAAMRTGRQLLIEADLRAPTLAQRLGIDPGPGLADVLAGRVFMTDAIQSVDLGMLPQGQKLDVLVAGAGSPPNPGQLLESRAMRSLLDQARTSYDFVIVDTPPLGAVSDAFPLLTLVDGILVVGRVGHNRRDAAEQLHEAFQKVEAPLLGVVANSVKERALTPYGYGYGYGSRADPPADVEELEVAASHSSTDGS